MEARTQIRFKGDNQVEGRLYLDMLAVRRNFVQQSNVGLPFITLAGHRQHSEDVQSNCVQRSDKLRPDSGSTAARQRPVHSFRCSTAVGPTDWFAAVGPRDKMTSDRQLISRVVRPSDKQRPDGGPTAMCYLGCSLQHSLLCFLYYSVCPLVHLSK